MTELLITKWPMFSPPNVLYSLFDDGDDDYNNNGDGDALAMVDGLVAGPAATGAPTHTPFAALNSRHFSVSPKSP